uniref:msDPBB_sym2 protein n=1 Tax=synthetic construct TaxID=32630 RepID=UPI001CC33222|nr:Chain A, msDPBB_sym2 protein [synthetic construct]7DWW_B Chain B, msDPBB_sym2 protein [synthetic construct]
GPSSVIARVALAHEDDVGKNIVRMDEELMRLLGVKVGDLVEIMKVSSVIARVALAHEDDVGKNIVRMDEELMRLLGVKVGDLVEIMKV